MSLESRILTMIETYRAEARVLELEGVAARRLLIRETLQAEALRLRALAGDLQDVLDHGVPK